MAGLPAGLDISAPDSLHGQRYSVRNCSFIWLCKLAYADSGRLIPASRVRVLSRDSGVLDTRLTGQAYLRWLASGHGWCYELSVPPGLAGEPAFHAIRASLGRLFPGYRVTMETQHTRSLVLVRTSAADKLRSRGGPFSVAITPYGCHLHNASLGHLLLRLERQYLQNQPLPLADGTGYSPYVDIDSTRRCLISKPLMPPWPAMTWRWLRKTGRSSCWSFVITI